MTYVMAAGYTLGILHGLDHAPGKRDTAMEFAANVLAAVLWPGALFLWWLDARNQSPPSAAGEG